MQAGKHLKPKLLELADSAGLDLIPINPDQPVEDQGPFDIILHKARSQGAAHFMHLCAVRAVAAREQLRSKLGHTSALMWSGQRAWS